ncbi:MAG TPA: hypothetical protein VG734_17495 [Lacunisphaera sp.]|nr:hypothetical protein [Lacunisphaera sp.]
MRPALSLRSFVRFGLIALAAPMAWTAEAPPPAGDPAIIVREALAKLEHDRQYAWEFRDLDGEEANQTVWLDRSPHEFRPDFNPGQFAPAAPRKKVVRTLSPTVQGLHRADGWAVTEAGFANGPKIMAVVHPSGARVVRSRKGEWLNVTRFRTEFGPDPNRLTDPKEQMAYSASWAALTSPVPHLLLPLLLRDASHFRYENDEIIGEVSAASARLLLGPDGTARKLAPERFKGMARLRIREGVLRECRIQLDYDVDLTAKETPSNENLDVLILFRGPLTEPVIVPEAARAELPVE